VSAEVKFVQWPPRPLPLDGADYVPYEVDYLGSKSREEADVPGGYYGYVIKDGKGAFVRVGFAQPCSQEERLDAARVLLQLFLLRGANDDAQED
jgi:hypothetical protein